MMIRIDVIRKRLAKLDDYLAFLRRQQHYSYEAFIEDPERYGSTERFLQLTVEVLNDLGNHVIADEALGTVDWHSDIPKLLCEHGYIDSDLRDVWTQMIGFRNILVHAYLDIDRRVVYQVLQEHLEDAVALREVFAQFL